MNRDRAWLSHASVLLVYSIGFYILTFPGLHSLTTHIFCDAGDGEQNVWNNWWVRHAVANLQSPWHTDYLHHPTGVTLFGATLNPFNGFFTVPLCWFVSPGTAYNITFVFAFVVGGYSAFLLARELGCSHWPAVFAGAVFTFSPFHFAHASHMQLVSLEWLPLFLFAWVRLLRRPSHGRAVFAGVTMFLTLLCDYYFALFAAMVAILLWIHEVAVRRDPLFLVRRGNLWPLLTFVLAFVVLCGPILWGLLSVHMRDPLLGAHEAERFKNDLFAPLVPGPTWRFASLTEWYWKLRPTHVDYSSEFGSYLGLSVILAAAYGLLIGLRSETRSVVRIWFLIGMAFYLCSLGPSLIVLGEQFPSVPMPYQGLQTVLPILRLGGSPVRMSVIYYVAAAVLAAFGVGYAWQRIRWRKSCLTLFLALFLFDYWPSGIPRLEVRIPQVIERVADLPQGAVLGLNGQDSASLLYQTIFEKPMAGGYIARVPRSVHLRALEYDRYRRTGDYERMMREFEGTYLIRVVDEMPPVDEKEFQCILRHDEFELFVRRTNPVWRRFPTPPASCDRQQEVEFAVQTGTHPSRTVIEIRSKGDAGRPFVCAFSRSRGTGFPLSKTHSVLLADDAILRASLNRDHPMFESFGTLGPTGEGTVSIDTSALTPGTPVALWAALIVLRRGPTVRICRISKPTQVWLRRK